MKTTTSVAGPTMLLHEEERKRYWRDGFAIVRGVLGEAEVAKLRDECDRLQARTELFVEANLGAKARSNLAGRTIHDRLDPVTGHSPLFAALARDRRLCERVASLWGGAAMLFKDRLIFKPPGVTGYGLHQDYGYWDWTGIPADGLVTVQVALDDSDSQNGAVILYPALHKERLRPDPKDPRDVDATSVEGCPVHIAEMKAGDVLFFHSLTPHRSEANRSPHHRRTLYFIYNDARCGDQYARYYAHRSQSLG